MKLALRLLLVALPVMASTVTIGSQGAPSSDPWCGS